jgi:hypothetical protein
MILEGMGPNHAVFSDCICNNGNSRCNWDCFGRRKKIDASAAYICKGRWNASTKETVLVVVHGPFLLRMQCDGFWRGADDYDIGLTKLGTDAIGCFSQGSPYR